jgi:endonuclease YncB( thermonuclease family)
MKQQYIQAVYQDDNGRHYKLLVPNANDKNQNPIRELIDRMSGSTIDQDKARIVDELLNQHGSVKATELLNQIQEEITAKAEYVDGKTIDKNESIALRTADKLGLLNPEVAEDLFIKSINGNIDPQIKEQIEEVQKALKADGKYEGEIDGKWGNKSREALQELILENAQALVSGSRDLSQDRIQEALERFGNKSGMER